MTKEDNALRSFWRRSQQLIVKLFVKESLSLETAESREIKKKSEFSAKNKRETTEKAEFIRLFRPAEDVSTRH